MTQEPETEELNLQPSNFEKPSRLRKILSWSSLGGTGGLFINYLVKQDWVMAGIALTCFVLAAILGFFWAYGKNFLETFKEGIAEKGKSHAKQLLEVMEQREKNLAEKSAKKATLAEEVLKLTNFELQYLKEQGLECSEDDAVGLKEVIGETGIDNYPVLQEIFVPLRLTPNIKGSGYVRFESAEDEPISEIWDLLRNSQNRPRLKKIAIQARGGYGKTTLLKNLASVYSLRGYEKYKVPKFFPFLLYLSACYKVICQDNAPSLPELLTNYHVNTLLEAQECVSPSDWVMNLLKDGQALVMFDGFDEIPSTDERVKVSIWLNIAMQKYRNSVFILTSRPTAYQENYPDKRLLTNYRIEKFNQEQRQQFLEKWYFYQESLVRKNRSGQAVQRKAKASAKSLLAQVKERPELEDLASNPLLLNMMVRYHRDKDGGKLPYRKFELYQRICELQLDRRPTKKGIELLLKSTAQRQKVLQFVALEMMKRVTNSTKNDDQGFKQISKKDLISFIGTALTKMKQVINKDDFLRQMVDVSELLVRSDENYEFSHLSFQSFLAAWELSDLEEKGEELLYASLKVWKEIDAWKDTILFYASLNANPNQLIQKLLDLDQHDLVELIYRQNNKADILEPLEKLIIKNRYQKLEEYLKAKEWEKADPETYRLMITAVGKDEGQWFSVDDLRNFPCDDLLAIDRLWLKHSNGLYGFSAQKQIYVECGGKLDFSEPRSETWYRFCDRVGWMNENGWVKCNDIFLNNLESSGHFPFPWIGYLTLDSFSHPIYRGVDIKLLEYTADDITSYTEREEKDQDKSETAKSAVIFYRDSNDVKVDLEVVATKDDWIKVLSVEDCMSDASIDDVEEQIEKVEAIGDWTEVYIRDWLTKKYSKDVVYIADWLAKKRMSGETFRRPLKDYSIPTSKLLSFTAVVLSRIQNCRL